ncbi:D-glucosaminate-6-phosphate ammonia lyase [soil metagenome]
MSIYKSLGVRPIINATGVFTRLGGTLMPDAVVEAMCAAAREFVCMEELQYQAGKVIAEITGAEAAYVVSGAQAGLVLSIAACMTGLDPAKMDQLPDSTGMRHEVIMAQAHRNHYDHAVEAAGGRIVEVGAADLCLPSDIESAITDKTAAILYLPWPAGKLALRDVVAVGKRHQIPVVVDGAGRCDEPNNLTAFVAQGADLVVFSGGKFIRGPQASGFVCGRASLISAIAWQHLDMDFTPQVWTAPRALLDAESMPFIPRQGIGRGYKAGKEEIVGLVTALQLFVKRDHAAERAACARKLQTIVEQLSDVAHVWPEFHAADEFHTGLPYARIRLDEKALGMTAYEFIWALKTGEPSIHPSERELAQGALILQPFGLQEGDDLQIVARVKQIVEEQEMSV